ncbi:OLC1v1020101C1 [Oldenlandia corymbosa var. corymbosa]|uniref:OLC1v1020101C1 n=1 Tax=Oldenlandia corymbosa var. corymbosa TaxID=529605 RepID=A0AAV1EFR3_OLDCO|nr:OLC1v1020101C1 [Oldenlandia corymbosa var. corymbosa]
MHGNVDVGILQSLADAGAVIGRKAISNQVRHAMKWQHFIKITEDIMVVASLIGTIAFQSTVSPPGRVWQESLLEGPAKHTVGEAVIPQTYPYLFKQLIRANAVAVVSSLCIIMVLLRGSTTSRPGPIYRTFVLAHVVIDCGNYYIFWYITCCGGTEIGKGKIEFRRRYSDHFSCRLLFSCTVLDLPFICQRWEVDTSCSTKTHLRV